MAVSAHARAVHTGTVIQKARVICRECIPCGLLKGLRISKAPETQKPQKFQEVLIEQSLELFSESGLSAYAGGYDVSVCNQECGRG